MAAQAFFYNAIFFTYALVLTDFFGIASDRVGLYILPFAMGNFLGPVLLGRLFDTLGRRRMIFFTYLLSGLLLALTGYLFMQGVLTAFTQTLCWMVIFFFASAAASSAYLTVSETFPLEVRALAIAIFYAIGTGIGGIAGPLVFGMLIESGSRTALFSGYLFAAVLMIAAACRRAALCRRGRTQAARACGAAAGVYGMSDSAGDDGTGDRCYNFCRPNGNVTMRVRLLVALFATAFCGTQAAAQSLDKVTFGTNWVAQPEHGGFYQALADGTYRKYGLDVTILPGGPNSNNRILLPVGKIDFYMSANLLQSFDAVEQKVPTVAVAASFQKDPQVFLVHPDQGIEKFEDLKKLNLLVSKEGLVGYYQWLKKDYGFTDKQVRPYNSIRSRSSPTSAWRCRAM